MFQIFKQKNYDLKFKRFYLRKPIIPLVIVILQIKVVPEQGELTNRNNTKIRCFKISYNFQNNV